MKTTISIFLSFCICAFGQSASYPLRIATTNYGATWFIEPPGDIVPLQYWTNGGITNGHISALMNGISQVQSNIISANLQNTNLSSLPNWSAYTNMIAQIPAGINDTSNRIVTLTGLQNSINSVTNSQTQLSTIMAQMANQLKFTYVYVSNLIVLRSYEQTLFNQ